MILIYFELSLDIDLNRYSCNYDHHNGVVTKTVML